MESTVGFHSNICCSSAGTSGTTVMVATLHYFCGCSAKTNFRIRRNTGVDRAARSLPQADCWPALPRLSVVPLR
jgi:hypothetical protein